MSTPLLIVDAFTSPTHRGNPAAVCLLDEPRDDAWMQSVASEMNLSETAFLLPAANDTFRLRWFTPAAEVDLCGHATLASAHALWELVLLAPDQPARFLTKSGPLTCTRENDWIAMDFPAEPAADTADRPNLLALLRPTGPILALRKNRFDYLVEVDSEAAVRAISPDFTLLGTLPVRGIIVTARASTPGIDFVSRFFAPALGIPEDPVTGSAHCALAPYWSHKLDKSSLTALQLSARGGLVRTQVHQDRVLLSGQARTALQGTYLL